ncbi:uncharacterized protein LOC113290750 [Papaver somniferum]|uniref:uncharacterized protein LOC113290750 n=1 Tax=Papaver somniferum TaxID=3469 RepID=UPI000E6FC77B|nr:uncharacterized protein LOC113290750 [Papaver somniferum]
MRVNTDIKLDEFKEQVCKELKQFTPLGICFFFREGGKEFPLDCDYSLQALVSITNSKKKTSIDIFLQNVTYVASSSSSREDSSISNGSTSIDEKNEMFQAYNRREKVYKTIYGDDVKSYSHLVWYIDDIKETNPGSVIKFEFDPAKKQFQRIFIAFDACIKGYRFCRPMVYLYATFLTGRFRVCLIAATGINGGKGFLPLVVALVDSETVNNWEWFIWNLTEVVGDGRPITFLSDRHEGLLQGVPLVYPDSFHSFCYYHLKTNLPINGSDPRYTLVLDLFQEPTYALSPKNHAKAIQKIRDLNCDWVAVYIETIPPESYVNAYFKGCRYGRTSRTLAEALNNWVMIKRKIMVMMEDRCEIGANMMTPLTPEYEEKLEALQDEGCVTSSYTRHMDMWRVYGFPCSHALAAIRKIKREAIDFISPYFTSDYFRKTYLHAIHPIPNYNRPVEIKEGDIINPPIVKKQPGRPAGKKDSK